jgi:hypothetical protein
MGRFRFLHYDKQWDDNNNGMIFPIVIDTKVNDQSNNEYLPIGIKWALSIINVLLWFIPGREILTKKPIGQVLVLSCHCLVYRSTLEVFFTKDKTLVFLLLIAFSYYYFHKMRYKPSFFFICGHTIICFKSL